MGDYRFILRAYVIASLSTLLFGALLIDRTFRQFALDGETQQCLWEAVETPKVCASKSASFIPFVAPKVVEELDTR